MSTADFLPVSVRESACSTDEHADDMKLLAAITAVYDAQGTDKEHPLESQHSPDEPQEQRAGSDTDEQSTPRAKKPRRGSGSSATDRATASFERVMERILPPPPPEPSADKWLKDCMITDAQRALITASVPSGAVPSCLILSTFDDDDFDKIKLENKQIKAWKMLAAAFKP